MSARIILALDGMSDADCIRLIRSIAPSLDFVKAIKIHDLYLEAGPRVVARLKSEHPVKVMVDLKFHDIPKTVGRHVQAVCRAGADIVTVHIPGGFPMMQAALKAAAPTNTQVWGITALTSLTEEEVHLQTGHSSKAVVLQRAREARLVGLHGIVCSPREVGILSKQPELKGLKFVTPGVRSAGASLGDQKRSDTPAAAIVSGAHYLVVGSEFTTAVDPQQALLNIVRQISEVEAERELLS